jgi:hypothetical protein
MKITYHLDHETNSTAYLLIPHDAITSNMTLEGLASRYQV